MVQDHLKNQYHTVKEMCQHYGLPVQTYYYRRKHGYSMEQALTFGREETAEVAKTRFVNCQNPVEKEERTDHLGKVYPSKSQMCDRYGISRALFDYRRNSGWTLGEALCTPAERKRLPEKKRTVDGVVYRNVSEIREKVFHNEISERVLCGYLMDYDSTGEAVRKAKSVIRRRKIRELRERILKRYGIDSELYNSRIWRGWSPVEALSTAGKDELLKEGRTFRGVTYSSTAEMCHAYGISPGTYLQRISRGVGKETALLTPVKESRSLKETEIGEFLSSLVKEGKIDRYIQNYAFKECRDRAELPFDFLVVKGTEKGIIEYDGRQHFAPNCFVTLEEAVKRGCRSTEELAQREFRKIRRHDFKKNEFCRKNRIPLLRIRYSQAGRMKEMITDFIDGMDVYSGRFNPELTGETYYEKEK